MKKSEWKTPSLEGEGKGDGHKHGRKPRTPEPIPIAWNSPSEEEMGHWTPTGAAPMVIWMDGWMDEWMDGWMDEWMDGWMNGWMDGWMDKFKLCHGTLP